MWSKIDLFLSVLLPLLIVLIKPIMFAMKDYERKKKALIRKKWIVSGMKFQLYKLKQRNGNVKENLVLCIDLCGQKDWEKSQI